MAEADVPQAGNINHFRDSFANLRKHSPQPGMEQQRLIVFDHEMVELQVSPGGIDRNAIQVRCDLSYGSHGASNKIVLRNEHAWLAGLLRHLSKPVQANLKLHRVDSRIRRAQTGIGDVLIPDARGERPALAIEELKSQRTVGQKIDVRSIQWDVMPAEQNAAAQFQKWHNAFGMRKVPL